jgi:hypothetical protein
MLKGKAEIEFTLKNKDYAGHKHFRLGFHFDDGLIFSANIKSDVELYVSNEKYTVDLEFFTIETEAYEALKPILSPNMDLTICSGRKILGTAKLKEYSYSTKAA